MDDKDIKSADQQALWQQFRDGREELGPDADPLALAAYLEGRMGEAEAADLEGHLARSPADLELLLAGRDALGAAPEAASPRTLERAKALRASPGRVAATSLRQRLWQWLSLGTQKPIRTLALAGTAGLYLALCAVTFDLGRQGAVETLVVSDAGQALDYDLTLDDVL